MPTYKVTDPNTGKTLRLTGDSPPTEQELEGIFSSQGQGVATGQPQAQKRDPFLPGEAATIQRRETRTDPVERLREEVQTPYDFIKHPVKSTLKPLVTGLKTLAVPAERAFSAIGGVGVGLQKVEGFKKSLIRGKEGLLGRKQYRSFDPLRNIGAPEIVAAPVELFTEIAAPLAIASRASKVLGTIKKASDKLLIRTADDLLGGVDEATTFLVKKLDDAYAPINKIKVAGGKVLDDIVELPKEVINFIEGQVGKLGAFLDDFDIAKARKLKRAVAEFKPQAFGKETKGAIEIAQDKNINKSYSTIKKAMEEALETAGKSKQAKVLSQADEAYTEATRAARFVKKTITDPTLLKPTKTGSMALKLAKEGDLTGRVALNTLKKSGFKANLKITEAVRLLKKYNAQRVFASGVGRIGRSATIGATAGLLGGRVAGVFHE